MIVLADETFVRELRDAIRPLDTGAARYGERMWSVVDEYRRDLRKDGYPRHVIRMMRTILPGRAGFSGSAIVWPLNELGHDDIVIVDRLDDTDKWKNLAPLKFVDYIDADDFID